MAANPQSFDIGPLSWVKAEIEHSLNEARVHLDKFAQNPAEAKAAKYAVTHLHQVTGALSMVGLGAATAFNEEVERLTSSLETDPNARSNMAERILAAKGAMNALSGYLDRLMSGEADRPMMLSSSYLRVNRARGATDASESDLFSPDLTVALPVVEDTVALPKSEMMAEAVKQRRSMYQAGLLKLLRDKDMVGGARDMRNATLAIEALQSTAPSRAFWYAAGGFFDAVGANPAEAGALAVQLFGKIDQQIKLLIEGVQKVPEKLFRDILLVIGRSKAQTERLRRIRELYRLDELLAVPDSTGDASDDEGVKAVVRALREQVQSQKDNWLKFTGGNRNAIEPYVSQAENLFRTSQRQSNSNFTQLIQALGAVGAHLKKTLSPPSEAQALEVATAFLFLESSLENYFKLTIDFPRQAGNIVERLKAAMTGRAAPDVDPGTLVDSMTKRAQERMLLYQVGQEVQVNLASIESALDSFFRDPAKMAELTRLPPLFSQVQGALAILELDEAAALNQLLKERVNQFASGAVKGQGAEAEAVAEGVSALGLFVAALQQGAADARANLLPALLRFGLAEKPAGPESTAVRAPVSSADVDVAKQKVQALYEDWKQKPEMTTTRDHLREAVKELKQEAALGSDLAAVKGSDDALKALESAEDPNKTGIMEALSTLAPERPAETPAAQVVQLIDAPTQEIDQELLEIFLEEAGEVVGTIRDSLAVVRSAPHDKESLTTIRRGFHTLKGSGRMVGLTDLGEVAWNCEQVMNKWLKDEKPASAGLMTFIDRAANSFDGWVATLKTQGHARIDGDEIGRAADRLKNDQEPDFAMAADARSAVATVAPEAIEKAGPAPDEGVPTIVEPTVPAHADTLVIDTPVINAAPTDEPATVVAPPPVEPPVERFAVPDSVPQTSVVAPSPTPATDNIDWAEALAAPAALAVAGVAAMTPTDSASSDAITEPPPLPLAMDVPAVEPAAPDIIETTAAEAAEASATPTLAFDAPAIADTAAPPSEEFFAADVAPVPLTGVAVPPPLPVFDDLPPLPEPEPMAFVDPKAADVELGFAPEPVADVDAVADAGLADDTSTESIMDADIVIGEARVPSVLFQIYLSEADEHVTTLDGEMAKLESGKNLAVSHEFMRAAHTLTSSSRTTGFDRLADISHAIEKWLQDAIEYQPKFDAERLGATRRAVNIVAQMVRGLHHDEAPTARDDVIAELATLCERLRRGVHSGEGTHLRRPEGLSEAIAQANAEAETASGKPRVPTIDFGGFDEPGTTTAALPPDGFDLPPAPAAPIEPAPASTADQAPSTQETSLFDPAAVLGLAGVGAAAGMVAASSTPTAEANDTAFQPPVPTSGEPVPVAALAALDSVVPVAPAATLPSASQEAPIALEAGKERRVIADDIDHDLLPIFIEEAKELMPSVGDALRRWRSEPANHAPVAELARHLHTLKGSARMAGLMRLGELAHVMEERVIRLDQAPSPALGEFEEVDERLDRFNAAIERLAAGDLTPAPIEIPVLSDVSQDLPAPLAALAAARAEIVAEGEKLEGRERQSLLRVNADIIDRFVNEAGEISIARSRVEQEMLTFRTSIADLAENVNRMRGQLREIEIQAESQIQSRIKTAEEQGESFDPLEFDRFSRTQELTRFLAESLNDVVTLQMSLQKNLDEAEAALIQQSRLNRDLQQGLMGVRLVPLGNLQDRFYRLMRQTAKELDKKANLEFRGTRVEIDRSVLEKITAPFEHLLRNAIAHGLESPAERAASGKPEIGEIVIDARQVGNEVVMTLSDDGAGLNFARIRAKAIAQGLLAADEEVSDAQLTQFIFMAGFSTAEQVSQVAGRGVGMDVVRNDIVSLGGRIDIASAAGRGTTFTIILPLTLAVTQAVLVNVGETVYAIPSVMIEQVQEYKGKKYDAFLDLKEIEWKGNRYPLRSMEALLGGRPALSATRKAAVILAKSGAQRAAVQVDSIIGNREIVVKSIGPQLARMTGIAGATMTGAGKIILILNPVQLVYHEAATFSAADTPVPVATDSERPAETAPEVELLPSQSLAEAIAAEAPIEPADIAPVRRANPLVMVVDDSLTVRKITSRMLLRENFEVATAKDGVDGLQQLQDIEPDIILLDIEMPRMDGFEFARNVRADARTKHIPIIMITSRTADKHRNHAIEIGVNEYMGKPYQEEQLLAKIREYTQVNAA
jgi:chemosensory pili system protein ChpA (sensor histidine kinase/response regulator)